MCPVLARASHFLRPVTPSCVPRDSSSTRPHTSKSMAPLPMLRAAIAVALLATPAGAQSGWTKVPNKYCDNPISTHYRSAALAQRACLPDRRCKAISDSSCDGKGNWATCRDTGARSRAHSCVYTKASKTLGSWRKLPNQFCNSPLGLTTYSSYAQAKKACAANRQCNAVSDKSCDGAGRWVACRRCARIPRRGYRTLADPMVLTCLLAALLFSHS